MAPIHTAAERGDHKHVLKLIQDDDANANLKNVAPPSNADHNFTPPRNFAVRFMLQFVHVCTRTHYLMPAFMIREIACGI